VESVAIVSCWRRLRACAAASRTVGIEAVERSINCGAGEALGIARVSGRSERRSWRCMTGEVQMISNAGELAINPKARCCAHQLTIHGNRYSGKSMDILYILLIKHTFPGECYSQ